MKFTVAHEKDNASLLDKLRTYPEEVTPEDHSIFQKIVSTELDTWQVTQVVTPDAIYPRQQRVLATHWHPEFIPMELNRERIEKMFPNRVDQLIIPTQHNDLMSYDSYTGAEVDCYASGFHEKVQLLIHFETGKLKGKDTMLRAMLAHTRKYRASQLFDYMHSFTKPIESRLHAASRQTGVEPVAINFACTVVSKIEQLLDEHWNEVPEFSIRNKLIRNYFDALRPRFGHTFIDRVQTFVKEVKEIVKLQFPLEYFYRASEIIEEVRHIGGGIIIPHPEQFWPILLGQYDVDGYEVWNPQSHRYTEFLIDVVHGYNKHRNDSNRLLILMGDDCHQGEKARRRDEQDPEKTEREVGYQPAWDNLNIQKKLIKGGVSRENVIEDYRCRLSS
ncbi:MAG: hypothetical protein MI749_19675 [Desulfovibrionales bacterium]|nr:hypothetical protein [Desulfovibrionales bacterium]